MTKARAATTNDMGEKAQQDLLQDWDRMAPVGAEFGSPEPPRVSWRPVGLSQTITMEV